MIYSFRSLCFRELLLFLWLQQRLPLSLGLQRNISDLRVSAKALSDSMVSVKTLSDSRIATITPSDTGYAAKITDNTCPSRDRWTFYSLQLRFYIRVRGL